MPENASTFVQGLYVMLVGMGVVFAALILVMLAIMALDRIFRPKAEIPSPEPKPMAAAPPKPVSAPAAAASASVASQQELAGAIALALAIRIQETEQAPRPAPVRVISVRDEPSLWAATGKLA